jgi:hypothetical protein
MGDSNYCFIRRDFHHNVNTLIAVDETLGVLQLAPKAQIAFENENN